MTDEQSNQGLPGLPYDLPKDLDGRVIYLAKLLDLDIGPLKETLKYSRVALAYRRVRRQGALRSAVLPVQSSSATQAAGAPVSPGGRARITPLASLAFL